MPATCSGRGCRGPSKGSGGQVSREAEEDPVSCLGPRQKVAGPPERWLPGGRRQQGLGLRGPSLVAGAQVGGDRHKDSATVNSFSEAAAWLCIQGAGRALFPSTLRMGGGFLWHPCIRALRHFMWCHHSLEMCPWGLTGVAGREASD